MKPIRIFRGRVWWFVTIRTADEFVSCAFVTFREAMAHYDHLVVDSVPAVTVDAPV